MPGLAETGLPTFAARSAPPGEYLISQKSYKLGYTKEPHTLEDGVDELTDPNKRKQGSRGKEAGEEVVRVRLPNKRNREIFGSAELMLGANRIRVRCFDGVTRIGRIKGKIKKKVWIREGDILIVVPWSFQDEKCDIVYRYTRPQVEWLRKNQYL